MFTLESSSSFERSHLSSSNPNIPVVRTNKLPSSHHPSPGSGQQLPSSEFTPYFDPTPGPPRPPVRQNLTDRYQSYEMPETVVLMPSTAQPVCDQQKFPYLLSLLDRSLLIYLCQPPLLWCSRLVSLLHSNTLLWSSRLVCLPHRRPLR